MPVDPSISLATRPAEIQSPVDQVTKGLALRDLITRNALQRQQIQQSQAQTSDIQQQVQQRQRDLGDQKTLQQAILDSGGDWDKAFASTRGQVSPEFQLKAETQRQTLRENLSKANKQDLDTHYEMLNKVDNALSGLKGLEPDQQDTEYSNVLSRFGSDKQLGPLIQQLQTSGALPHHYDSDALNQIHAEVVGRKGLMDEAKSAAETKQFTERANAASASAKKTNAEIPGTEAATRQSVTAEAAARLAAEPDDLKRSAMIDAMPHAVAKLFEGKTKDQIQQMGLNDEQQVQKGEKERELTTQAGNLHVSQQREAREAARQAVELGTPAARQTLVDSLKKNPDAISEIPAQMKTAVMEMFVNQTGLPFPKPSTSSGIQTETAAHNVMSNAKRLLELVEDKDVRTRLGAVLGRVGEAEQDIGKTAGLNPEAASKVQEFRTLTRYFNLQEAKTLLGARMPQKLVELFNSTSPQAKLDEPLFRGAMKAVIENAGDQADNVDKERFGGKARPRVLRGFEPKDVRSTPDGRRIATDDGGKTVYNPDTGEIIPR